MSTRFESSRSHNAAFTGLLIIAIGVIWLLRKMGVFIPGWLISWQMILIVIGLGLGVGNKFRNPASWILIVVGALFLINDIGFIPFEVREYIWPILVIIIGLVVLVKPKRNRHELPPEMEDEDADIASSDSRYSSKGSYNASDKIDSVSIFNGLKRTILSKRFRGGETVTIFGGTEINLLQADFEKVAELEATVILGGLKLIVPRNWEVRTEVTSILGGVEDKRYSAVEVVPENKVLVLTGTIIFGGLDIVSY